LPFIVSSLKAQLDFGARREKAVCLGTGKLYTIFRKINAGQKFFKEIIPVEHPRFIMQYRRKRKADYLKKYVEVFSLALT